MTRAGTSTARTQLPSGSEFTGAWALDPEVVFLNHGSFGACPRAVMAAQSELRARMESEPVRFFIRELPELLHHARTRLASFLGADPGGLAFVVNATSGVNTALRAIPLAPDDEILLTDHGYNACWNAVEVAARQNRARVVKVRVPVPISSPEEVIQTVLAGLSTRTRIAVIDHVTSPTGLVFPLRRLVQELEAHQVTTVVDGAHAPGMVALDLSRIGAPFYTGNCHKWMCAPKGAAFLAVRDDWRERTHPLVTSHGATAPIGDQSRFHLEFDWTGTADPTPWLSIPVALETVEGLISGGWPEVRSRNRELVLEALALLCTTLDLQPPSPDGMIGSMAALPLPPEIDSESMPPNSVGGLQERLYREHRIEVAITSWGQPARSAVRISAHLHNSIDQYRYLASALVRAVT